MHLSFRYCILLFLAGGIFTFIALNTLEHQMGYDIRNEIMERLGSNQWIHQMIDDYKCPSLLAGNQTKSEYDDAHDWSFSNERFFKRVNQTGNSCSAIRQTFDFYSKPLSKEEEEYPLAYGMIVYKDEAQVYLTVSAFYHPQHIFCIVVDGKSSPTFKRRIHQLDNCFSNIYVIEHEPISWCEKSVLHAQYTCFRDLTLREHPWKYYQYITGFDLPAKSNLETIRILKHLNGAAVVEVVLGGDIGLESKKSKDAPFKVWKSGMAATVSRQTADDIFKVKKNTEQMDKLMKHLLSKNYMYSICNDELFWSTVLGNKKTYNITGSFSSHDLIKNKIEKWRMPVNISRNVSEEPYILRTGLLARYQRWNGNCNGTKRHGSCVFGIGDLPKLITRHELIYHKFHVDTDPMAYFCLWKHIKDRNRGVEHRAFKGNFYKLLPQVQLFTGTPLKEALKWPTDEIVRKKLGS